MTWRGLARVLAIRLDNLGDLLMTTPALAAMRASLPAAQITLLTSPGAAAAAPHLPMVDAVWPWQVPWMPGAGGGREIELVERLANGGFDAAVIFSVCTQSALPAALVCRMAGIPRRLAHSRENPYGLLTHWVPETDAPAAGALRHEAARQLDLVAQVGWHIASDRLRFVVHEADRRRVAERLAAAGIGDFVLLHPGASAPSRRWPAERFAAVGAALADTGLAPVVCGGADEADLVQAATPRAAGPVLALAGALTLGELAALIERAQVLVCNNSAPAHLAAALGTPVVCLYALTNPQHTPWRAASRVLNHDVPCRGCHKSRCPELHHACLREVQPADVAEAARALLAARAGAPPRPTESPPPS